mgnify:CR=1 FL=1
MKIVSVVGARPQFIKLAPLSRQVRDFHKEIIIHSGQHYDNEMSQLFFDDLEIPKPDYNLGVGSGSHAYQTSEILVRTEKILHKEKPDLVIVYGDTNTTIAASLAAAKMNIKIAHIESGLRSFNTRMPEEINRVLTDHCSNLLFAPTQTAVENLRNEGITNGVHMVGDIMYDALINNIEIASKKSNILNKYNLAKKGYILLTIHRQENTDIEANLCNIISAAINIDKKIVFPVHPRTIKFIAKYDLDKLIENSKIEMVPPLGYLDFINLLKNSEKIMTDSGGVQKEAYILEIPCVTLRNETEWVETVHDGWNTIVGTDIDSITNSLLNLFPTAATKKLFGEGNSSKLISDKLSVIP